MKKQIILLIVIFNCFLVQSQTQKIKDCGTEINSSNIQRILKINKEWRIQKESKLQNKSYNGTTRFVPVQIHIIRRNNGTGGVSEVDIISALDLLNTYYIKANIQFFQCTSINYIDNSIYYDFKNIQKNTLDAIYSVANVLNIYIANTVTLSGKSLCGFATFPGGIDFIMLRASCVKDGSTLAHEVGHYFGLYHTHETAFGHEAVNGFDCTAEGDFFCDTPADPKLKNGTNLNNDGCVYYGSNTDENGESYSPSVINLMSYTAKECSSVFTEEQYQKIFWVLENRRAYLTYSAPALESYFYISEEETCESSKLFSFYNASVGNIINYSWDFGDGIGTSSIESPSYTYLNNGVYNVSLTVGDGSSTEIFSETIVVGAVSVPYTNDFEKGVTSLDEFSTYNSMKNEVTVHASAAKNGSYGLLFDGTQVSSTSPFYQQPSVSFAFESLWNLYYKATAKLCVDASNITNLQLEFDKKQIQAGQVNNTNFRVTVNGVIEGNVYQVNNTHTDDSTFTHITIDLSAYDGQVITIGFEGTHKYNKDLFNTNDGTATFIDNINITGEEVLSIIDFNKQDLINIYPNPTKNLITLKSNKKELEYLLVTNVLGQDLTNQVMVKIVNDNEITIDLTRLNTGVYYIKTKTITSKVLKK